jgi:hypothetical protein
VCASAAGWAQETVTVRPTGNFVPAGTLLGCTLDEINFSSQTARTGDPVLCKTTNSVVMFGRPLIPRGSYLAARLQNYRDPGHFVGKGWLQLEFTSLTLPGGSIPIDAKVIAAARYRVNGDGKIMGRGHATRDAVEWAIPILWPIKVLTLPARGPRPTLKAETRIQLRLMEDLMIPESTYVAPNGLIPRTSALQPGRDGGVPGARLAGFRPAPADERHPAPPETKRAPANGPSHGTLIALRGGLVYLVSDYWVDKGKLHYTVEGTTHDLNADAVDVPMTRQLNAERGVPFVFPTSYR